MSDVSKPNPRITRINRPFFEACNRGAFVLQRCRAAECGRFAYFPRVCCPHCQGGDLEWVPASGRGRIETYTVVHRPQHRSFFAEAPYIFIAVRLDEGPLMYSRLAGGAASDDLIGAPVRVVFHDHTPEQKLPFFELAAPA